MHARILVHALAAALLSLGAGCSSEANPPNLLLISVDTLRPDRLGCYGHERETSPAIDALAAGGVLFEHATSASPWTLPSHASLLTGRYPSRHGVKDHVHRLSDSIPTLATTLAKSGYQTFGVVNSHNLSDRYGLDQGFQRFEYVSESGAQGRIPNRGKRVVGIALNWLAERSQRPFFLFLHSYDVHTDLTPSAENREHYCAPYEGPFNGRTSQLIELREREGQLEAADAAHLLDLYDAEIRTFDDVLGGLFAWLEREGLLEETLVVLTSDHGEEFGEHGSVLHGRTYFEEVIRIPMLMRGPGVPAGRRVAGQVHLVDVAPTLLAAAGIEPPPGMDGIDLQPFWSSAGATPPERSLFAEADHNNAEPDIRRMLRTPRHKLVYDRLLEEVRLFDLEQDPGEARDLAADEPELTGQLLGQLLEFAAGGAESELIEAPDAEIQKKLRELGY